MAILSLKDITDECSHCGELFTCELCRTGHGFKCERENVGQMVLCQIKHEEQRKGVKYGNGKNR